MDPSTSAGFTFPGDKKGDCLYSAHCINRWREHKCKSGIKIYKIPYKVAFRPHLSQKSEPKVRLVWITPIETEMMERRMFQGIIDSQKVKGDAGMIFFGKGSLQRLHGLLRPKDSVVINADVSRFDSSLPAFVIRQAF